jgi:7-keto-8-aminopelargonate synthetase-like enzyme
MLFTMKKTNPFFDTVDQIVTDGVNKGILHLYNEDTTLLGNSIVLKGNKVVNFGSCSYLGLEFDERLKEESKKAIDNYGTQFSESRAYVSVKLYKDLENHFNEIFDAHCIVTPTTTLGHIANIPVLVCDTDAILIDHQVHSSVQTAIALVKARGVYTELIRHNRMDLLEQRIIELRKKHNKIWYMADGIYSMFGDKSPVDEVYALMDKYPELHFYVDDAHGMSIYGKNGRGYVLDNRPFHAKMVVATSLAKAFATGGAVMVYPDYELARRVRTCGGPLITSGPMQPAQLGAAIASAKIHLSPEIYTLQNELSENILFANMMLRKHHLPIISQSDAAVFFVGVSLPKMGYNLIKRMLSSGYYLNLGIFPAVPIKNTGVRFTITRLHTFSQIESMIKTMAEQFQEALIEEGLTLQEIYKAFKLTPPEEIATEKAVESVINQGLFLKKYTYKSIHEISQTEWDSVFENKGTFNWEGLSILETAFTKNVLPEDNWAFDYIVIKDNENNIVLATFLTTAIWKDDMLSPSAISMQIEQQRKYDKYYLTSKVVSTGSLLTEGEHLFLDSENPMSKDALLLLLDFTNLLQERYKADKVILRDFTETNKMLDAFFVDNGYFKFPMPANHVVTELHWQNEEEFYQQLSKCSKDSFKRYVKKHENKFKINCITQPTEVQIDQFYKLYLNVKNKSLDLNTFTLPKKVFREMCSSVHWEIITLELPECELPECELIEPTACVIFCYKTATTYNPMLIGMDYECSKPFQVYRQALYQVVKRGQAIGKEKINFGFSASIEKKKMGAKVIETFGYAQAKDNYSFELIESLNKNITSANSFKSNTMTIPA